MSFDVTGWPLPDDIDRYRKALGVPAEAIIRDIARLVTIAQMAHAGDLSEDLVLTGGMAMRLRGSPRFTMSDTDNSRRLLEAPDRERLAEALTVDQAELTVTPGDVLGWKPGKKLVTARPVNFEAFFAGLGGAAVEDQFTFTVSWRGLVEPAENLVLVHPNPELHVPRTVVPVMDLSEQVAEKIVAWCAHGLMKHYVDVAWAFYRLDGQIDRGKLGRLVDAKPQVGRDLFATEYAAFRTASRSALRSNGPTTTCRRRAMPPTTTRARSGSPAPVSTSRPSFSCVSAHSRRSSPETSVDRLLGA